jgi:DNA-binding Xre family transcriptional regulator
LGLNYKLGEILNELEISKNALAVEGKIRPATVAKYEKGDVSRIESETLLGILNTANKIARQQGKDKTFGIEDLIEYTYEEEGAE